MVFSNIFFILIIICFSVAIAVSSQHGLKSNGSSILAGIELLDHLSFNSVTASENTRCCLTKTETSSHKPTEATIPEEEDGDDDRDKIVGAPSSKPTVKLHLKHGLMTHGDEAEKKESNTVSRLTEKKLAGLKHVVAPAAASESDTSGSAGRLVATLESGVSLESSEYFMDVFVGTPPKHFFLILDTGSGLNWIQCLLFHDCFEQNECHLLSSLDPPQPCKADNQSYCPYFYWYMTSIVSLTSPTGKSEFRKVEKVMFRCGHWNRGLFHGASGLLGLGRGPLCRFFKLSSLRRPLCHSSNLSSPASIVSPTDFEEKGGMEVLGMKRKVGSLFLFRSFNPK
uniref:Peptidase A1 domain-containing protein n=1 Tax=Nelumbo nucifera TaxID=4432 RepID=A0A822Z6R3_NELNU|nr:TPA_asm: hypothetical protein HUJ06_014850 [Nelumbo nucifera]